MECNSFIIPFAILSLVGLSGGLASDGSPTFTVLYTVRLTVCDL